MSTYHIGEVCIVIYDSSKIIVMSNLEQIKGGKSVYTGEAIGPCLAHKVIRLRDGKHAWCRPRDMRKHPQEQLVSWTEVMSDCGWMPAGVSR